MKKTRKIIALIVAMVMSLSLIPQTVLGAEFDGIPEYTTVLSDYFYNWHDWSAVSRDGNLVFLCVTDEIAHDGNNSFVLRHVDGSKRSNICLAQNVPSLAAGTYTISFWAVGTTNNEMQAVTLADPWKKYSVEGFEITETDGRWSKYEKTVTAQGGETAMTFLTDGNTSGWYIDDISLVKQGTTTNLIKNGGFEETESGEVTTTPTYTTEYEEYFTDWVQWYEVEKNDSTYFSCVTNANAHDGSNSVVLRNTDNSRNKNLYVVQENLNLPTGTYMVSFWATGTGNKQFVNLQGQEWLNKRMESCTAVETDGAWSKYELEFTVPAGKTNNTIVFGAEAGTEGWYIDDISLVKQGTTTNLIKNGSFEEKVGGEVPEMPDAPAYTTEQEDYLVGWSRWDAKEPDGNLRFSCVTDEIAHSGNNSIVLRHSDSANNGKGIGLAYDKLALAGTYILSFWAAGTRTDIDMQAITLNGDAWVRYSMQGRQPVETDGDWSKYVMELTVPDGITDNAIAFFADGETNGWYIDDVSLVKKGETENLIKNGGFEEKAAGDGGDSSVTGGAIYTSAYEEYFASWGNWSAAELDNVNTFYCVTNEIAHSGNNSVVIRHTDPSQSWKAVTIVQEGLSYGAGAYTFSFWAAGNYSNNLCGMTSNGGWWDDFYLTDFTVAETDGDWKKYTVNFTVPEGKTQNAITLLSNGDTQGLYLDDISLVKSGEEENLIKNGGFEEKDPSIPVGDVVKEVVLRKNGQRTDALMGAGDYSVTLVVDNAAIDTKLDVEQFVAIYDEDGVLYNNVHSTAASIEKATASGTFTKIETDFVLPEGNFTVEYFVFDGRDTLNIIGSSNPHRVYE